MEVPFLLITFSDNYTYGSRLICDEVVPTKKLGMKKQKGGKKVQYVL